MKRALSHCLICSPTKNECSPMRLIYYYTHLLLSSHKICKILTNRWGRTIVNDSIKINLNNESGGINFLSKRSCVNFLPLKIIYTKNAQSFRLSFWSFLKTIESFRLFKCIVGEKRIFQTRVLFEKHFIFYKPFKTRF